MSVLYIEFEYIYIGCYRKWAAYMEYRWISHDNLVALTANHVGYKDMFSPFVEGVCKEKEAVSPGNILC